MNKIQWTDRTWNPVRGCSRVSEGCRNCYAERIAARFSGPGQAFEGFATDQSIIPGSRRGGVDGRWTGKVALVPEKLDEPLHWRKPARVFVNSMSDLFHEKLDDEDIDLVFAAMAQAPWHTFQILTKRPKRMLAYFTTRDSHLAMTRCFRNFKKYDKPVGPWPLPNVWLGVSVEDQATADERIPLLLQTPAAVRFVSYEPALGSVDFTAHLPTPCFCGDFKRNHAGGYGACGMPDDLSHGFEECKTYRPRHDGIDWVIYGGESGPGARPNDVAWARATRDACKSAGVAFFCKQLGARPWTTDADDIRATPEPFVLPDRKGGDPEEWSHDLRVREFPR